MKLVITFMLILFLIMILIMNIIPSINIHKKMDREKNSPFECGFDPFTKPRLAFSIHFFYISLMFLIFDIEITLILPSPLISKEIKFTHWMICSMSLFIVLTTGLYMEWKEGSMNWN